MTARTSPQETALERFWAKVKKTEGCWLWTARAALEETKE